MHPLIARFRAPIAVAIYALLTAGAYYGAWFLRFEFDLPADSAATRLRTLPILVGIRIAASLAFRITLGRWRFVGAGDVWRLGGTVVAGSVAFLALLKIAPGLGSVPRSVLLLEAVLSVFLTAGVWLLYRTAHEHPWRAGRTANAARTKVLIVGAGEAGNLLAREIRRLPSGYAVAGFVDDDPRKKNVRLQGTAVLGATDHLEEVAGSLGVREVLVAMPSAPPERLREIAALCGKLQIPVKVLPGIREVLAGEVRLGQLRPLRIEDLLGREPVRLDLPELMTDLKGQSVLITGAAGSIGSELARQVAANGPRSLLLLDQAETPLFFVERELRELHPGLDLVCMVGDILDQPLVEALFRVHQPSRVFHAAAYKHVPMMEVNPRGALLTNTLGTWRVAEAAGLHGAGKFILISTDKAVRPSSVMGASKRLAERAVLEAQAKWADTAFFAVRFGNVLGSNGSVIPIFRKQLEEGKPLTVTHPDVTRYFMTIAEAVQLVLQASLLPEAAGRVAMLDMGEPVRIVDLAREMIRLSGADPETTPIDFTGLRKGEKLHEELMGPEEATITTANPKVVVVSGPSPDSLDRPLLALLEELETLRAVGEPAEPVGLDWIQEYLNVRVHALH